MEDSQILLKGISALAIIAPIAINLWVFKTAGLPIRLFCLFLFIGLTVDLIMWYFFYSGKTNYLLPVFNFYSLIEALFFFWFIQQTSESYVLKSIARKALWITLPFWIFCIFIYPYFMDKTGSRSAPFDTTYEIAAAFLSGFALLKLSERQEPVLAMPYFWLLLGIFFYCFCTFFLMSLLETFLSQRIWFLNNIINIITYIFYTIGLWKSHSTQ